MLDIRLLKMSNGQFPTVSGRTNDTGLTPLGKGHRLCKGAAEEREAVAEKVEPQLSLSDLSVIHFAS
jgi:hypothetical protein